MKVLILSPAHLLSNSGIHITSLANALTKVGVECLVCVPAADTVRLPEAECLFKVVGAHGLLSVIADHPPDLVYLWTPREGNRKLLELLRARFSIPYIVHFEDNEFHLCQVALALDDEAFAQLMSGSGTVHSIPDHLTDPSTIARTVAASSGVTVLVEELLRLIPQARSSLVFWPGYDESLGWGTPVDMAYRREIGIDDDEFVVAYTGNLHSANVNEVRSLYLAVALLNRRGTKVRLVRTGADFVELTDHGDALLRQHSVNLGFIARSELPRLLAVSDVLVQPGAPDAFNIYRFPSKIPEFLASRRPVVLPNCNIGAFLNNGVEAIVLPLCNAAAIVSTLEQLLPDPARRLAIGEAGAKFAKEQLQWSLAAANVSKLFQQVLSDSSHH